ncbi:MAG: hypothetical protein J7M05_01345 [Anaerolineae bacterium]|nr:hypothetical protein [Anaerolineae bacterium]
MRRFITIVLTALFFFFGVWSFSAWADCPGNLLANPGFEEGSYKTEGLGTSLSSNLGKGWLPWSILGDATYNREVEYKVLDAATLPSRYHIHSGNHSQKFFTTWGTHTAGFYQRVKVVPGSKVTFSIWVQIYTGERELLSGGNFISDLEWPTKPGQRRGPGMYRVSIGIDPYGDVPPGFGAPPSPHTVWSETITDYETRTTDAAGREIDAWVKLTVSTIARAEYVTVYTRGQPEYPVKHNDSFWDDACLVMELPPTATPRPTLTPTPTLLPSATSTPTATASPTVVEPSPTPKPTATEVIPSPSPSIVPTERPTQLAEVSNTPSPSPTLEKQPTASPTLAPAPEQVARGVQWGLILIYVGTFALAVAVVLWLRLGQRH